MTGPEGDFALETRWRLGHRLFEVVLAAIIEVLKRAALELAAADFDALCRSLETLAGLLESATSAMQFTADFDPSVYRDQIRPTMEPPKMPPGFSGTLNERHAEFLENFRGLDAALKAGFGNRLESAPPELENAWRAVLKMRSKNLAAHGLVCEKFVPGGESLLKEHLRSQKEKS
jgi:hypothetical protein